MAAPKYYIEDRLCQKDQKLFSVSEFSSAADLRKEKAFFFEQKYTCRNSIHTFPSVPDFMKPVREGRKLRREEGKRGHQGSDFLFLCFLLLCLRKIPQV